MIKLNELKSIVKNGILDSLIMNPFNKSEYCLYNCTSKEIEELENKLIEIDYKHFQKISINGANIFSLMVA